MRTLKTTPTGGGEHSRSKRYKCVCVLLVSVIACALLIWNVFVVGVRKSTPPDQSRVPPLRMPRHKSRVRIEWKAIRPRTQKERDWTKCKRLIKGSLNVDKNSKHESSRTNKDTYNKYLYKTCYQVRLKVFSHPVPSKMEKAFPIAYGVMVYKGLPLLERLLQAIYMPQNVYCLHVDKKSPSDFHQALKKMISCLPNVFVASQLVDVKWGEVSILSAEFSCLRDLYKHEVQWKYYLHLVGQDFPLYNNYEIVRALKSQLNGTNNIKSLPLEQKFRKRTVYVYKDLKQTKTKKSPPPYNITIRKGAVHGIFTREFVQFLLESPVAKGFLTWCNNTGIPDETYFPSLQTHALTPGGIQGDQPAFILKLIRWGWQSRCCGKIVRQICWISVKDLQWVLDQFHRSYLFIHKIPFDYEVELLDCLTQSLQKRKYPVGNG